MLAGLGMAGAGLLLERASNWTFLTEMPEAMILVPALLGLKGNLEMTLASRLSTMVNQKIIKDELIFRQIWVLWTHERNNFAPWLAMFRWYKRRPLWCLLARRY